MGLQTCCEIPSLEDMDHMDKVFEERCAEGLKIINQLESMGVDPFEFCDNQPPEIAQKCLDILSEGFEGSYADLQNQAKASLGIKTVTQDKPEVAKPNRTSVEKSVEKPVSKKAFSKTKKGSISKKVTHDTKRVSQEQVEKISSEMKGKMPKFLRDKLADPSKQLTKKQLRRLPDSVKDTLHDIESGQKYFSLEKDLGGKRVKRIGGSKPKNFRFANHVMFENVPKPARNNEPVEPPQKGSKRAKKVAEFRKSCPNGITFDEEAYPVGYAEHSQKSVVCDDLTGDHNKDLVKFDDAGEIDEDYRKKHKLAWEHDKDGKTGHLIPKHIHEHFRHTGGAARLRADKKKK